MEHEAFPSTCPQTWPFAELGRNCARWFVPVTRNGFLGRPGHSLLSSLFLCIFYRFHGFSFSFFLFLSSLPFFLTDNFVSSRQPNRRNSDLRTRETLSLRGPECSKGVEGGGKVGYSWDKREPSRDPLFSRLICLRTRCGSSRLARWHTWEVVNR